MPKHQITKLDAARRQIEIAINLFFYERDFVAIHTLAAAAFNVLDDLRKHHGIEAETLRSICLKQVYPDKMDAVTRYLRAAENFFKHADRDPLKQLTYDTMQCEWLLFDSIMLYKHIAGETPPAFNLYWCWFMANEPEIFEFPEEQQSALDRAELTSTPKQILWEEVLPLLSRLQWPREELEPQTPL